MTDFLLKKRVMREVLFEYTAGPFTCFRVKTGRNSPKTELVSEQITIICEVKSVSLTI